MRKKFTQAIALWVLPPVGALLIRFIYFTCRKRFNLPSGIPSEPVVLAFWHGDLLMLPYLYYRLRKVPKIKLMISEHFDGQILAKTMEYFAFGSIRGSTRRGAAKVLIQALKSLSQGFDIGITPDGPKGPRHELNDGVVVMAQKRQAKVMVLQCLPSSYWQLSSWDRFTIPKPFSTLEFYASEPIDLLGLEMEEAKAVVKARLMEHAF